MRTECPSPSPSPSPKELSQYGQVFKGNTRWIGDGDLDPMSSLHSAMQDVNRHERKRLIEQMAKLIPPKDMFHAIGGRDMEDLVKIAEEIDNRPPVVRTVFGAAEEYPMSALAYAIPALKLVDEYQRRGIAAVPQFIIMQEFGTQINRLDPDKSQQAASLLARGIDTIVNASKYPHRVEVTTDTNILQDERLQALLKVLDQRYDRVPDDSQFYMRHGDKPDAQQYGCMHAVVHSSNLLGPQPAVNIGAQSEIPFYELRHQQVEGLEGFPHIPNIQLFTHDQSPPYMSYYSETGRHVPYVLLGGNIFQFGAQHKGSLQMRRLSSIARFVNAPDANVLQEIISTGVLPTA